MSIASHLVAGSAESNKESLIADLCQASDPQELESRVHAQAEAWHSIAKVIVSRSHASECPRGIANFSAILSKEYRRGGFNEGSPNSNKAQTDLENAANTLFAAVSKDTAKEKVCNVVHTGNSLIECQLIVAFARKAYTNDSRKAAEYLVGLDAEYNKYGLYNVFIENLRLNLPLLEHMHKISAASEIASRWEKQLAERMAKSINGIAEVESLIKETSHEILARSHSTPLTSLANKLAGISEKDKRNLAIHQLVRWMLINAEHKISFVQDNGAQTVQLQHTQDFHKAIEFLTTKVGPVDNHDIETGLSVIQILARTASKPKVPTKDIGVDLDNIYGIKRKHPETEEQLEEDTLTAIDNSLPIKHIKEKALRFFSVDELVKIKKNIKSTNDTEKLKKQSGRLNSRKSTRKIRNHTSEDEDENEKKNKSKETEAEKKHKGATYDSKPVDSQHKKVKRSSSEQPRKRSSESAGKKEEKAKKDAVDSSTKTDNDKSHDSTKKDKKGAKKKSDDSSDEAHKPDHQKLASSKQKSSSEAEDKKDNKHDKKKRSTDNEAKEKLTDRDEDRGTSSKKSNDDDDQDLKKKSSKDSDHKPKEKSKEDDKKHSTDQAHKDDDGKTKQTDNSQSAKSANREKDAPKGQEIGRVENAFMVFMQLDPDGLPKFQVRHAENHDLGKFKQ